MSAAQMDYVSISGRTIAKKNECVCVCKMPMVLNCTLCFSIWTELLLCLISAMVDVQQGRCSWKWTVAASLKRAPSNTHLHINTLISHLQVCLSLSPSNSDRFPFCHRHKYTALYLVFAHTLLPLEGQLSMLIACPRCLHTLASPALSISRPRH